MSAGTDLGASPDLIGPHDLDWIEVGTGNLGKILRYSPTTGDYAMLVKTLKGSLGPRHRHVGTVNLYVISGWGAAWNGYSTPPGSWVYERDQAVHDAYVCEDDTLFLVLGRSGGIDILDGEGRTVGKFRIDEFVRSLPDPTYRLIAQDWLQSHTETPDPLRLMRNSAP